jgi:GH15 family glucan-1,4-alpha-glucosidase
VSDFMSVEEVGEPHMLVRRARTVRGEVRFRKLCAPRFDCARSQHRVERVEDGVIFTSRGSDQTALRLRATVPVEVVNRDAVAEFTLPAGNSADFVLEPASLDSASPSCAKDYVSTSFKKTINYWRRWVARSTYQGR